MNYGSIDDEDKTCEYENLLSNRKSIRYAQQSNSSLILPWILFALTICIIIFFGSMNLAPSLTDSTYLSEIEVDIIFRRVGYPPITSMYNSRENVSNVSSITYDVFDDFFGVIEPHSPMIIELFRNNDALSYHYSLGSGDIVVAKGSFSPTSSSSTLSSESITVPCFPFDEFLLKVSTLSSTGKTVMESSFRLICMYVRREIRSLHPDDLSKTLDAMLVMYTLDESEGKSIYGENFHSSTHFVEWHFFNAAQQDADHIHEGTAFLIQHVKATNLVERSMQAVDPSVSLPYWDYTIEGENFTPVYKSPIFTENIFGNFSMPKDLDLGFTYSNDAMLDAAIPNGRFAKLKADRNTKFTTLKQSYGFMRSPWNLNPNPFVSRYTFFGDVYSLPTCSAFYCDLEMTDLNTYLSSVSNLAHGTTHLLTGGVMGCEMLQPIIDLGYINATSLLSFCLDWSFVFRALYRYYYVEIPECTAESFDYVGTQNCSFDCKDAVATGEFASASLNVHFGYDIYDPYEGNVTFATYLSSFICGGNASKVFVGDHLESASPADPSFWPIHPNLERVFHAKLLSGGFETEDWPTEEKSVCTTYKCYGNDTGKYEDPAECCRGHHLTDRVFDYETGTRKAYIGQTNEEVLLAIDPRYDTYNVSYIYDSFVWSHCEKAGVNITNLLGKLSAKYKH